MNRGCGDTCVFGIVLLRRGRVVRLVRVEEHDNLTGARIPDNMNFAVHKKYNHDGWDKISRHIYRVYMYYVCVCVHVQAKLDKHAGCGQSFWLYHLFFQLERLHEFAHVAYALALFIQLDVGGRADLQGQK